MNFIYPSINPARNNLWFLTSIVCDNITKSIFHVLDLIDKDFGNRENSGKTLVKFEGNQQSRLAGDLNSCTEGAGTGEMDGYTVCA